MKSARMILAGILLICLVSLIWLQPKNEFAVTGDNTNRRSLDPGSVAGQSTEEMAFYVSEPVASSLSPAVRDLPPVDPEFYLEREVQPRHNPLLLDENMGAFDISGRGPDPLLAHSIFAGDVPPLDLSFEGMFRSEGGGFSPPDTIGDIGPNHYVQMVNVAFSIYDRSGLRLSGPTPVNQLFSGVGGSCETGNWGDPVVVYDGLADRWLLSQFNSGNRMCVAISQTGDPTGAYHRYAFALPQFPDYFKFGVWPDAYYMSANEGSYTAYAFDRTNMLAGNPATFQRFSGHTNLFLPSDLDGPTPPPAGSPNYFYTFKDGAFHGGVDRLEVWEFVVDFVTPANSTFTLAQSLPVTAFNFTVCGFFNFNCIQQLGTPQRVDSISEWPMWRLPYRNFGTHEAMVGNFAIDVTGSQDAGIRWFELRKSGGGGWTLYQEGTYAPDGHSRWLGSMAMDQDGNIALGYSVSSTTLNPSIRYTVRMADDPLGTLRPEATLIAGGGSQTSGNRWGDYSAMSIDPLDDCTFWYTNEYLSSSGTSWQTRVGAFKIPSCGEGGDPVADLAVNKTASDDPVLVSAPLTYTLTITNHGPNTATGIMVTDTLPAEVDYISAVSPSGSCLETGGVVTCQLDNLANTATTTVTIAVQVMEAGELENTAVVSGNEEDPDSGNNTDTITTTAVESPPTADLSITKAASADPVLAGAPLTYTLTIANEGPDSATGIMVTDTLPVEVNYLLATSPTGSCLESSGVVTCQLDDLADGATTTVTIAVQVVEAAELVNTAVVSGNEEDPDSGNNTHTITTTAVGLLPEADLAISKAASSDSLALYTLLTYTLSITNYGPDMATGILVTDTLPAGVDFVSATTAQGDCHTIGNLVICELHNLADQETAMIIILVVPTEVGEWVNTAVVTANEQDPDTANNTASVTVTVHQVWSLYLPIISKP